MFKKNTLAGFFDDYIGEDTSLDGLMVDFGIESTASKEKDLFLDALCSQFGLFLSENAEVVTNVIPSEYSKLTTKEKAPEIEKVTFTVSKAEYEKLKLFVDMLMNPSEGLEMLQRMFKSKPIRRT